MGNEIRNIVCNSKGIKKKYRNLFKKEIIAESNYGLKCNHVYTFTKDSKYKIHRIDGHYFAFYNGILLNKSGDTRRTDAFVSIFTHVPRELWQWV